MTTSSPLHAPAGDVVTGRVQRARETSRRWGSVPGLVLLVADPETDPHSRLCSELQASGVSCTCCSDGAEALIQYGRLMPDAVVLSAELDVVDAPTVARTIHERSPIPILLGVGAGDVPLAGPVLLAGATATVAHPFAAAEILQRLDAQIPRLSSRTQLTYGPLQLDPRAYTVRLDGEELTDLPLKEFELLRLLMMNADRVVNTDEIRRALWGDVRHATPPNRIAVYVARLRARLGGPTVLRTVRGRGYRLTFPNA